MRFLKTCDLGSFLEKVEMLEAIKMKRVISSVHRGLCSKLALPGLTIAAAVSATQPCAADFLDTFDSGETIDTLASTWVYQAGAAFDLANVVADADAPSSPNSFLFANTNNNSFEVNRQFTSVSLSSGASVKFSIYVDEIPNNTIEGTTGNRGFQFRVGASGGTAPYGFSSTIAEMRFLLGTATTFGLLNSKNSQYVVGPFQQDQWYDFEVRFTATDATSGTYQWYIDDSAVGSSFAYSGKSAIDQLGFSGVTGNGATSELNSTFYIDDVSASAVPEPASLALLGLGTLLIASRHSTKPNGGSSSQIS